jgi:hypothetical protein
MRMEEAVTVEVMGAVVVSEEAMEAVVETAMAAAEGLEMVEVVLLARRRPPSL